MQRMKRSHASHGESRPLLHKHVYVHTARMYVDYCLFCLVVLYIYIYICIYIVWFVCWYAAYICTICILICT